jgi:hypothetical protein
LGGISPTIGGYIADHWGVYHRPKQNVYKISLGGISPTIGGYITDHWGVYHRPLGGISPTKTPLNAAETLVFFAPKLKNKLKETYLKPVFPVDDF